LDREYLYTVVGDLKPVSDGSHIEPVGTLFNYPDLGDVTNLHRMLPAWQCGDELYADIAVTWTAVDPRTKKRKASLLLVNRPAFRNLLERKRDLFGKFGFIGESNPSVVYLASWTRSLLHPAYAAAPSESEHNLMVGHLMDYPDAATEWYAQNAERAKPADYTFVQVPVYRQAQGLTPGVTTTFFWLAPREHVNNPEGERIKIMAETILAEYKARRQRYLAPGGRGIVEMMRDWFDDGKGRCAPSNATRRLGASPPSK
jgi:hypothetical protein